MEEGFYPKGNWVSITPRDRIAGRFISSYSFQCTFPFWSVTLQFGPIHWIRLAKKWENGRPCLVFLIISFFMRYKRKKIPLFKVTRKTRFFFLSEKKGKIFIFLERYNPKVLLYFAGQAFPLRVIAKIAKLATAQNKKFQIFHPVNNKQRFILKKSTKR